jgi:hypothetical protein
MAPGGATDIRAGTEDRWVETTDGPGRTVSARPFGSPPGLESRDPSECSFATGDLGLGYP